MQIGFFETANQQGLFSQRSRTRVNNVVAGSLAAVCLLRHYPFIRVFLSRAWVDFRFLSHAGTTAGQMLMMRHFLVHQQYRGALQLFFIDTGATDVCGYAGSCQLEPRNLLTLVQGQLVFI